MNAIDVLVAEDDEDTRAALVNAVTSFDYRCRSACDGREALEEQGREAAAIVLTDWGMPRLDGLALCDALKRGPSPPYVILMTTVHPRALLFDAVRRGADEFLRKPFDLDELEVRLLAAARLMQTQLSMTEATPSLGQGGERASRIAHVTWTTAIAGRGAKSSSSRFLSKIGTTETAQRAASARPLDASRFRI